jgi:hypothetical protein
VWRGYDVFRRPLALQLFQNKGPGLRAIGWLQRDHEYPVGDPGPQAYERLKEYREGSWRPGVFLGGHTCDLCTYDGFYSHKNIVVPGRDVTYVAPEGIVHMLAVTITFLRSSSLRHC